MRLTAKSHLAAGDARGVSLFAGKRSVLLPEIKAIGNFGSKASSARALVIATVRRSAMLLDQETPGSYAMQRCLRRGIDVQPRL